VVYGVLKIMLGDEVKGLCTIATDSKFECKDFWYLETYYYGSFTNVTFENPNATDNATEAQACGDFRLLYDGSQSEACTIGTNYVAGSTVDCYWLKDWRFFGLERQECRVHNRPRYFQSLIAFCVGVFFLVCSPATLCVPRVCCRKGARANNQYARLEPRNEDSDHADHADEKTAKLRVAGDQSAFNNCCGSRKSTAKE